MLRIGALPWQAILAHAVNAYPEECCGALTGRKDSEGATVTLSSPLENLAQGDRRRRYQVRMEDLLRVQSRARDAGLELLGIYHSHPDTPAFFSPLDLENACPWYTFLIVSIRDGVFDHARCWRVGPSATSAEEESLIVEAGAAIASKRTRLAP